MRPLEGVTVVALEHVIDVVATLIGVLERAGLAGPALAHAQLWVTEATMGLVLQEAAFPLPEQIAGARVSLRGMSDAGRERLAPLMPHLGRLDADAFFDYAADRTIAALAELVERRNRAAARNGRPRR
mgnify:CR=1 FL=1